MILLDRLFGRKVEKTTLPFMSWRADTGENYGCPVGRELPFLKRYCGYCGAERVWVPGNTYYNEQTRERRQSVELQCPTDSEHHVWSVPTTYIRFRD